MRSSGPPGNSSGPPGKIGPTRMRRGQLTEQDYDLRSKQYHLYVQWVATNQLENLAEAAGGGLYLDLPLGVRPDGYDVWRWHDFYACEASVGSPPDAMWTKGQNWGFPPLHPERIRHDGYRHVREYLRHHLRLAHILRIDHVMQLHRLYWVPRGLGAHQGAYVQYRPEEFYAILNLESHRCRSALVGENLGTVPPAVNQAMQRHDVQPMYVVQYEIAEEEVEEELANQDQNQPAAKAIVLRKVPADALASMNTHDMATFAAWWRGEDIWLRRDMDLIDQQEADRQYQELQIVRNELTNWLRSKQLAGGFGRRRNQNPVGDFQVPLVRACGSGAGEFGRSLAGNPAAKRAGHRSRTSQLAAQSRRDF